MTISHPKIKQKLRSWQTELRMMTGNKDIQLYAVEETPIRPISEVCSAVEMAVRIDLSRILKRGRKREIVHARQMLCYCLRKMCKMTYPGIARQLGYNDHTSVMHSENEVIDRLRSGDWATVATLKRVDGYFENIDV